MVSGRSSTGSSESSSSCSFGGPGPGPVTNNGESSSTVPQIQVDMIQAVAATNGPPLENNNHVLITLQEKRVITEFCHLLEKSKQLFNQLRYTYFWPYIKNQFTIAPSLKTLMVLVPGSFRLMAPRHQPSSLPEACMYRRLGVIVALPQCPPPFPVSRPTFLEPLISTQGCGSISKRTVPFWIRSMD